MKGYSGAALRLFVTDSFALVCCDGGPLARRFLWAATAVSFLSKDFTLKGPVFCEPVQPSLGALEGPKSFNLTEYSRGEPSENWWT